MNKSSQLKQTLLAAIFSTTAATFLMAQPDTSSSQSQSSQRYGQRSESSTQASQSSGQVQKINKCSQLMGMAVKNQQGEKLGDIKEVVIDFSSDRVGYVVLGTDRGVLSAEHLHAVPLRAFQPSADGTSLILNADKDKLANAQGFNKDNWPSPSNPTWGAEPFWQESGTSPGSQYQQPQNRPSPTPRGSPRSSESPSSDTPSPTTP